MKRREFKKFLAENLKHNKGNRFNNKKYNFDAYCQDLKDREGATGCKLYELNRFETKSGCAETFAY